MSIDYRCKECGADACVCREQRENANLRAELERVRAELAEAKDTQQCADCGSTGPFTGIVYPCTSNGPEEYDVTCVECGSVAVNESPRSAFHTAERRWTKELEVADARAEKAEAERDAALKELDEARARGAREFDAHQETVGQADALRARVKVLEEALLEIARVKRGGIEANDSDEEWFEFFRRRLNNYESLARAALNDGREG